MYNQDDNIYELQPTWRTMVVVMSDLIPPCGRTSTGFSRVRHPEWRGWRAAQISTCINFRRYRERVYYGWTWTSKKFKLKGVWITFTTQCTGCWLAYTCANLCSTANIQIEIGCLKEQFNLDQKGGHCGSPGLVGASRPPLGRGEWARARTNSIPSRITSKDVYDRSIS